MTPMLSIVVPVLNEARILDARLNALQCHRVAEVELIVVDGGSVDRSAEIAAPLCDRTLVSPPGRACQMNAGAEAARGTWLLFLHADTILSKESFDALLIILGQNPDWGWFNVRISGKHPFLPLTASLMNLRSAWTGIATGDQGLFVRQRVFQGVGGFPVLPLMEDIALCKSLREQAEPVIVRSPLVTDGRRWDQGGWSRTVILMWLLRWGYWCGISPERLSRFYAHVRN